MVSEMKYELVNHLIPFWSSLRDDENGGYYGYMDYDLRLDRKAEKGCIQNSRIIWFFSEAYRILGDRRCLDCARHGYEFFREYCLDGVYGGVFWSLTCDGRILDDTKHTYNQAFAIYALCAYHRASGDPQPLAVATELYETIEERMRDPDGYAEAFDRSFRPVSNEKLSENGVLAERTMNTLLHVLEAYTELLRATGRAGIRRRLHEILNIFMTRVYNPQKRRLEVFFDRDYHSLIDLHSYGHDIEAAWLADRAAEVLAEPQWTKRVHEVTEKLEEQVYQEAFDGSSLPLECENGAVNPRRVWWVQAEAVNGFLNAWQKRPQQEKYLEAAGRVWEFIRKSVIDRRQGSEWFWAVDAQGTPFAGEPIVEPWKCPYHNGRMCMEAITREMDARKHQAGQIRAADAKAV